MNDRYSTLVNAVERSKLKSSFEVVCWCVGYYGAVDIEILELIWKLRADNFID